MKQEDNIDRRKFLVGAAGALAAGVMPAKALAARHPIDPEREAADAEALEIEEKMRAYHAFVDEKSYFIQSKLMERQVFKEQFVDVFTTLMEEYVRNALRADGTAELDGLRILVERQEMIGDWMIEEIKQRWKVGDDSIKEERIQSLIHMLSNLARESLEKEKPDEQ